MTGGTKDAIDESRSGDVIAMNVMQTFWRCGWPVGMCGR